MCVIHTCPWLLDFVIATGLNCASLFQLNYKEVAQCRKLCVSIQDDSKCVEFPCIINSALDDFQCTSILLTVSESSFEFS
jgi:hypothetical protein